MADMKNLAELMKTLEDQLIHCMRCGMCQAVCPLFSETGRESDVARGKLALLDGLVQEMFKDPRGVEDRLSRCLLCGSCAANCPSGVKVLDIFFKARAILAAYQGLSPAKRLLFRGMLAQPELFDRLLEWGARVQGWFIKPVDELVGTSCARFASPLFNRHFKALAEEPFHAQPNARNTRPGVSGLTVGFFTGCVIDKVFPQIGDAVLKSLDHHGVGVFVPKTLGCCGIPALSSGDTETFRKLVLYNLDLLNSERLDYLVTACATCTSTIKKLWPMMMHHIAPETRLQTQLQALADKTMDIAQFLVGHMGVTALEANREAPAIPVSYHDPCHLKKSLGIAVQPRTLINASRQVRLKEMGEADWCCGCGGSFNLQHYALSASIGRRKRDNIVRSGCAMVATSCPACMLQLSDMLSQGGDPIRVKHVIELYAESLDLGMP